MGNLALVNRDSTKLKQWNSSHILFTMPSPKKKKKVNFSIAFTLKVSLLFPSTIQLKLNEQHIYDSTQNENGKLLKVDWGFFLKPFRKIFQEVFVYQSVNMN